MLGSYAVVYVTQTQHLRQQRPESPTAVALTRYILWWSLCTRYLLACRVEVTVGDSGLCRVCVTSLEC